VVIVGGLGRFFGGTCRFTFRVDTFVSNVLLKLTRNEGDITFVYLLFGVVYFCTSCILRRLVCIVVCCMCCCSCLVCIVVMCIYCTVCVLLFLL